MISGAPSVQPQTNSHAHLDSIFESVKRQVKYHRRDIKYKTHLCRFRLIFGAKMQSGR
jgi:hypothetical protein